MGLGVELLKAISLNVVLNVAGELGLVALLIVVGEGLHVLSDVASEDVLAERLGVKLLGLDIVTREAVLGVGHVEATVGSTLHGAEDAGTSGGTGKTNIKEDLEGAALVTIDLDGLGELVLAIRLLNTGEVLIDLELLQGTAGKEQTGSVGGSPVGKTVLDAIGLELVGVGSAEDAVTADLGGDDLLRLLEYSRRIPRGRTYADDVPVGEADNQAVLGGVVLVLGLGDQALAGIVIGLALSAALVLDLVPREVRIVLDQFGLQKSQSQQLTLQTRIRSNLQDSTQRPAGRGCTMVERMALLCLSGRRGRLQRVLLGGTYERHLVRRRWVVEAGEEKFVVWSRFLGWLRALGGLASRAAAADSVEKTRWGTERGGECHRGQAWSFFFFSTIVQ